MASHRPRDEEWIETPGQSQGRLSLSQTSEDSSQKIFITRNPDDGSPNVSLNTHGQSSTLELVFAAISGAFLQLGVLVYAGLITYYPSLKFTKDDKPVASYAYPCTAAGTLLLVFGIALCAHVVESSTREKTFGAKNKGRIRTVWLQQQKIVSDQTFKSCIIYAKDDQALIKSSRRYERHENGYTFRELIREAFYPRYLYELGQGPTSLGDRLRGLFHRNRNSRAQRQYRDDKAEGRTQDDEDQARKHHAVLAIKTVIGTAVTLNGFILQFIGLRGMHWSTSIAQLGAVFVMVLFKAWLRRRLARPPHAKELAPGFELDWLAKTLGRNDYAQYGHWGGNDKTKDASCDWIIASDGMETLEEVTKG